MNIRGFFNLFPCFRRKPATRKLPGRWKVRDASFPMALTYRMNGLFPGTVTRTHPQWIEPCLKHAAAAPIVPGMAVMVIQGDNSVAPVDGTWTTGFIYGVAVRSYPVQNVIINGDGSTVTSTPEVDILREGYIGVAVVGVPSKLGLAYIWTAATSGPHTQGGFEAAASGANTALITNAKFNGPPDAQGNAELVVNIPAT
jgi:hypothetical protein